MYNLRGLGFQYRNLRGDTNIWTITDPTPHPCLFLGPNKPKLGQFKEEGEQRFHKHINTQEIGQKGQLGWEQAQVTLKNLMPVSPTSPSPSPGRAEPQVAKCLSCLGD